jgi:hypothetical protein
MTCVPHDALTSSDLVIGHVYEGGRSLAEEPLDALLHCGNMGGFRIRGSAKGPAYVLSVLYTTFEDPAWPDTLDVPTARFVYFGDNKTPGRPLHETPKGGNELLRQVFDAIHVQPPRRRMVPPFFVFSKAGTGRDVRFHGLATPGAPNLGEGEDLVAIWRTCGTERFQNYRAVFTLLDEPVITRAWINDLLSGGRAPNLAPTAWHSWVESGTYRQLRTT